MAAAPSSTSSRDLVQAFFDRLGHQDDVEGWLGLLAADIVVDTPFSPTGDARRFEGIEAVERRFADARRRMTALEFLDARDPRHRGPRTLGRHVPLGGPHGQRLAVRQPVLLDLPGS